ncbi:MAG: hypothetical protein PVF63_10425 [Gammaproteobacteria bacterium]|jgi:2-methylisocitrate lyase-like PEP mutase family enzyme
MTQVEPQQLLSAGSRLRRAMEIERPLQLVGTVNAYSALLAQSAGFRAIYLSGAGVSNASFGLPVTIERVLRYVEVGADVIFGEALTTLEEYRQFVQAIDVPVLGNITEFGVTPLFSVDELELMQTRDELYEKLEYLSYEQKLDRLYGARDLRE